MNEFLRFIFLVYFITHIPISIILDFQAVFRPIYPAVLRNLLQWYTNTYHDYLMANPPIWFKTFILAEMFFQMPFFFFAIYCLWYKRNFIRIPGIIYGIHVSTILLPILGEFYTNRRLKPSERNILLSFYLPYLIIPFLFAVVLVVDPFPFPYKRKAKPT